MPYRLLAVAAASLLAVPVTAPAVHAAPYDAEYVFGGSLSDRGNLAETGIVQQRAGLAVTNFPNPPSFHDSFTNGPVAVQILASALGLNADPSLWPTGFRDVNGLFGGDAYTPGTNYAVAGATAAPQAQDGSPGINLPQQVRAYLRHSGGTADPNALYVVLVGGNDVIDATLSGAGPSAVVAGVASEVAAIQALSAAGARNFLVPNVPSVGILPLSLQDIPGLIALTETYRQLYDARLAAGLAGLALPPGTALTQFDLYAFDQAIFANPSAYGLTNTTDPCFTDAPLSAAATPQCGPNGQNVDSFFYWDDIHPTATVHALIGEAMLAALGDVSPSTVTMPEPSSAGLLGAGLLGLAVTLAAWRLRSTPRRAIRAAQPLATGPHSIAAPRSMYVSTNRARRGPGLAEHLLRRALQGDAALVQEQDARLHRQHAGDGLLGRARERGHKTRIACALDDPYGRDARVTPIGRGNAASHLVLRPVRRLGSLGNGVHDRVLRQGVAHDLPSRGVEAEQAEERCLGAAKRVTWTEQVIPDLALFDDSGLRLRHMRHAARSPADTVTTAWKGSNTSTSYPTPPS